MAVEKSQWQVMIEADPEHSHRYAQRFRLMEREGHDVYGEARLVDAMLPRGARVLDAGCGAGRVGGYLHAAGHHVVGVDLDPVLIQTAREDYPGPTWLAGDLAELDLPARAITRPVDSTEPFDVIVGAGNVMTFLAPSTRGLVLANFARHLTADGRAVIGFGGGRGYEFEDFFADARDAGLRVTVSLSSWDARPFHGSDFLVAILAR